MRRRIFVIVITWVLVKESNAQLPGVPDTLAYLNTIVNRKAEFVGRPFSVLMDSLKIQIQFFSPFAGIHYKKSLETSTSFAFYFSQTDEDHYLSYPRLRIFWQPYLNITQSDMLWETNNGGSWSPTVAAYYSNAIIANIGVSE